ncbi:DUF2924 domain-containing protein [Tsuneonella sp. YG55]|uniref:DUF2924 domain-containing protein n=1 Tax=Tsuneonella litorea TaxID=2976475 RepID=A0A9X2W026_9SPHN|nr:DUF2924 domain-containing protein [Tsuneonella litorea]MCT2557546.1 DUF2924 domain-containing protein [Tsuneonella litorea]
MTIEQRVAAIAAMPSAERKAEWHRRMGTAAPPAFGAGLLARALAHDVQVKALGGGLTKAELRRLAQLNSKDDRVRDGAAAGPVKPGTWLSRTWHGEVHQVVVLEGSYEYRGVRYRSLSEIARLITGTQWSGPRFFGLHSPRLGKLAVRRDG